VSRFSVLEVSYLGERRLGVVIVDDDDSYAPAPVGAQESAELAERERVIIDVHDGLALRAFVDEATKDRASGHPLASRGEVVELLASAWDLDDHMLTAFGLVPSRMERVY
jgi:hypothetical protein